LDAESARFGRDTLEDRYMFRLYLIAKTFKYYVGQTADIRKKMIRHNLGVVPSYKGGAPGVSFAN